MDTVVREAVPGDGPGIATLITEEAPHFDLQGYPEDLWPDHLVVLVAEREGHIVGWLEGILDGEYEGSGAPVPPPHGYILAIVVDEEQRHHGIGGDLIEKFMEEALAAKVEWVFLIPEGGEGCEDRVRFFIHSGFTPTEVLDEKRLIMARWT